MKRGRPKTHIKAKWVTFMNDDTESFFELDDKGKLIPHNKKIVPHHTNKLESPKTVEEIKQPIAQEMNKEDNTPKFFPSIISPIIFPITGPPLTSQPFLINLLPLQKPTNIFQATPKPVMTHVQQLSI